MSIFTPFTSPRDTRWQGVQKWHHAVFLLKNVVLIFFIPLVIVEGVLFNKWWDSEGFKDGHEYSPYYFWLRIGMALVPDLLVTTTTFILILNPLHRATISCHPIYALISAFALFALYVSCAGMNWLIPYSNEVSFDMRDSWENICLAELAVEALLALCWFVMFVLASIATRKWDVGRRTGATQTDVKMGRVSSEEGV